MAAGRIVLSQYFPARDRNGRLVAGARLFVYLNGTTTKAPIYAQEGLTTPLANPVSANASGQFPAIWASDAVTYTLSITAADGSSIGNPSVFDDYSVSTDADTASVALAEAAAASAQAVYDDVLAIQAEGSDAAAIATRAAKSANLSDLADKAAATNNLLWKASAPALTRLLRSRIGETVSVLDYVVGNGSADDTEAYQELMNMAAAEYVYPPNSRIALTSTVLWNGERTHRFQRGAGIWADVQEGPGSNGYGIVGQGYPDLFPVTVTGPIARFATSFTVDDGTDISAGDDIYLYDIATEEYDINRVRAVVGDTVFTERQINNAFATAANIRAYSLANACRNVKVIGGEIRNVNTSDTAHGLAFFNATDIDLDGTQVIDTGGIGIYFAVAQRFSARNVAAIRPGRSGLGVRNGKDFLFSNFIGRSPQRDESLTFYKNVTHGLVDAPDIQQYLNGQHTSGVGQAGNCILLDERICDVTIRDPRLRLSATYAVYVFNGCERIQVINPDIQFANLGGVRFATNCKDSYVGGGWITDVTEATDSEQAGIATAGVQDDATCSGNVLGDGTRFARIGGNINVRQSGLAPAASALKVRGAMAKKVADQTAANYSTPAFIAWDAEAYDTNAIHDPVTNNTRFTVPAGVSFVEIGCTLALDNLGSGSVYTLLAFKNGGATYDGFAGTSDTTTAVFDPHVSVTSGPLAVTAGDYFEWRLYCDDSSITVVAARSNAWMRLLN